MEWVVWAHSLCANPWVGGGTNMTGLDWWIPVDSDGLGWMDGIISFYYLTSTLLHSQLDTRIR